MDERRSGGNSASLIAGRLRTDIRQGVLSPGTRLVQEQLAAELAVSRIPLREALHTLAAEGLIEVIPQRGMLVAELDSAGVAELFELRLRLEPPMAPEVVRGCRDRDVDRLQSLADRIRDAGDDPARRAGLNYEFHRAIYELAERHISMRFIDQLLHLVEPYSSAWVRTSSDLERINAQHQAMVDAIRDRDVELLEKTIVAHIEGARDHVLPLLTSRAR